MHYLCKLNHYANLIKTYNMEEKDKLAAGLPENAFRELKEGEQYEPLMSPDGNYPEPPLPI